MKQNKDEDYVLEPRLVVLLFNTLLDFVLLLGDNKNYHSDIKEGNIIIVETKDIKISSESQLRNKHYRFKVIDFGSMGKNEQEIIGWTRIYYWNPIKHIRMTNPNLVVDAESRLKGEIFQVIRTLQSVMITKNQRARLFILQKKNETE